MTMLWLNQTMERTPDMGFRTRILCCAATAAAIPFMLLATSPGGSGMILTGAAVATLWFLFCLSRLLLPIRDTARAVAACAEGRPLPDLSWQQEDEIGRMAADIRLIADRLDSAASSSPEVTIMAPDRSSLEPDLRRALGSDQFVLHYQPVVDLGSGRLAGAEALVRWQHPELGLLPPVKFIPALEETGLMNEVGPWILDAACRQARAWEEDGLTGLKMAVNLSARQLRDPSLKATIVRTLDLHGLQPQSLELELKEMAAMENMELTRALFTDLRSLGVSLAIDDFGSGYSSLSYVRKLPFDKLKIDREFVTNVEARPDSQAICRALIELTRGLSLNVLAEGVETREEVETLRGLGCTMFQGFYFARPLTAEIFAATVRDPNWLALLASPVHREIAGLRNRIAQ